VGFDAGGGDAALAGPVSCGAVGSAGNVSAPPPGAL
jgi:hypothetical protein